MDAASFLRLLLLQVFHSNWLLAQRTRIVRFQPVRNALRVEEMLVVAGEQDNVIVGGVLIKADHTLDTFFMLAWVELPLHHLVQKVSAGWNPIGVRSSGSSNRSY